MDFLIYIICFPILSPWRFSDFQGDAFPSSPPNRDSPEVDVQHTDRCPDGQRDEYHGKEQILAQQGHRQRGWWDNFGQEQEKHGQRHEYWNT